MSKRSFFNASVFVLALANGFSNSSLAQMSATALRFAQTKPGTTILSNERDAIHKVISGYYDATSRSPAEGATFYGEPTLLVLPNQVTVLAKRSDVEEFLAKLVAGLKPLGFAYAKVVDPHIKFLNPTTAMYSTMAIRFKADGTEMQRAGFTYLLQKDNSGWRIRELIATDLDKLMNTD